MSAGYWVLIAVVSVTNVVMFFAARHMLDEIMRISSEVRDELGRDS